MVVYEKLASVLWCNNSTDTKQTSAAPSHDKERRRRGRAKFLYINQRSIPVGFSAKEICCLCLTRHVPTCITMLKHAISLYISIRTTLFYLRTENVYYAFMKRPTESCISTLRLHDIGSALYLIIPAWKSLAHEYMKNEHKQAREAHHMEHVYTRQYGQPLHLKDYSQLSTTPIYHLIPNPQN